MPLLFFQKVRPIIYVPFWMSFYITIESFPKSVFHLFLLEKSILSGLIPDDENMMECSTHSVEAVFFF